MRVLIVEDEVKLSRFIELELKHEGYSVDIANDGRAGLTMFKENSYDMILLDLMLPEINGMELIRRVRLESQVPVIMITAKADVMDKVSGLDSGADDYITKPFAIEELLARMRVALKKNHTREENADGKFKLKNLVLEPMQRVARVDSTELELTKTEFDLLLYMVQNKNIVLTRDQIINHVWGYNYMGETNVVDVYIRYIRAKLDDRFDCKYINTIRGVGYIAKDE